MQECPDNMVSASAGEEPPAYPEGISPEYKEPVKKQEAAVLQEDILQREKCLITVGRLIPRKGMDYLARVAVPVLKKHPDWKWLVVGDGEERAFLEDVIRKNQLKEQLILTGRTDDVGNYLIHAQIYVMTSRIEGLPMCLLEAKTFRIPSVSFDIPTGPSELIEDGVNGYLIKPFDCKDMVKKLDRLLENETLRRQFSVHAQDNLEKFQMEHILGEWNWLLEKL
jgi:glycosyltransferase involved in cell wall biosynthesis